MNATVTKIVYDDDSKTKQSTITLELSGDDGMEQIIVASKVICTIRSLF